MSDFQSEDSEADISASVKLKTKDNKSLFSNSSIFQKRATQPYVDPPMPYIGKNADINVIIDRNIKAKDTMEATIIDMLLDSKKSIEYAKSIPPLPNTEHISVSSEIYDLMKKNKSKLDFQNQLKENQNEIRKALLYRSTAIDVMNANYSRKIVADSGSLDIDDSRSIIKIKSQQE